MTINTEKTGSTLTIVLEGRLDTVTSPQLDSEINAGIADVTELIFDFTALEYISSSGLRVLLAAQKVMNKQGKMIIKNPNDTVREVFDITGFSDILTIE